MAKRTKMPTDLNQRAKAIVDRLAALNLRRLVNLGLRHDNGWVLA